MVRFRLPAVFPVLLLPLLLVVILLAPPPARALDLPGLSKDAQAYASALQAKAPPQTSDKARDAALAAAAQAVQAGDFARAVASYEQAVIQGDNRTTTWLALADAWAATSPPNPARAVQAAWLAWQAAEGSEERTAALTKMADLLAGPLGRPREALSALEEIESEGTPTPALGARIAELRRQVGLVLRRAAADVESDAPRICLDFSGELKPTRDLRLEDFVRIEPAVPVAAEARESSLCLTGVGHGASYKVTVRQGLPGRDSLTLHQDETVTVRVGDRRPSVAFRGNAFILPRAGGDGVPVVTVNLEAVSVRLYRINDRNLVPRMASGGLWQALYRYEAERLAEDEGELVWDGRMELSRGERNRSTVTALPVRQILKEPKPGLYVLAAEPADLPSDVAGYGPAATQWLMLSDIGLTALRGADGVTVFARSFGSARPIAGLPVTLVARNNAELAKAVTDESGRANFAPAAVRGSGGNTPAMVMAHGAEGDFALLDLTSAAFDLTDRGVGGRPAPGPLDAFLYSDRGVYRPGEMVNLTALLRDDRTAAAEGVPLTLKVLRPSGTEFFAGVVPSSAQGAGAHVLALRLTDSAPLGTWTVNAYADPKAEPIGRLEFQVEEFVPERLAVEVAGSAPALVPGQPFEATVKSRFLYGPPAAGLSGTAELSLEADPDPYPMHKDYRFGLAEEEVTRRTTPLEFPVTDAQGVSRVAVALPTLPDTTRPLRAEIRVTVAEPGGRPTREGLTVPVRAQPFAIGIRPRGNEPLAEGEEAAFDVIAVDAAGTPIDRPGLRVELLAEHTDFQWYMDGGRYSYRTVVRSESLRAGKLDAAAARAITQNFGTLPWGRYRVEVADPASGVATSVRFAVGWPFGGLAADVPDKVVVTADRPAYRPGEAAKVRIAPPFAGEVLLTVATDRVIEARNLSVPAEGATVELPVGADWGPGAYVTATVYRPPVASRERLPVRAIGLTWLSIDPAERSLNVAIEAPETVTPRQALDVAVRVTGHDGAPATDAFLTLAAVDEGILQLTDFVSPDPVGHFHGKRRLGLDIRDDYGRLIDPVDGPLGLLRQGGDEGNFGTGLPVVPVTIVSLFQGPVTLDAQGRARLTLDLPDFNGELRLMAVAFDRARVGAAARPLTVRDPLVAEMVLPRFLAPGDDSQMTLSVHNVGGAPGTYRLAVTTEGGVAVGNGAAGSLDLAQGERRTLTVPLRGTAAGTGTVRLAVDGPGGLKLARQLSLTVRPARAVETAFTTRQMPPGAVVTADAALVAGYLPGTAGVRLGFGSKPPFDVAGLLGALDRYPYGCLEQQISRALPLLVVKDVDAALGQGRAPDDGAAARVDRTVAKVLDLQRYDGSFGLWSARSEEEPWATAYALEFLARARAKGHAVPEAPFTDGLDWLRRHALEGGSDAAGLASRAYALHVLALAGVATPGPARYVHDAFLDKMPTPLARAQLAAALSRLGDRDRARTAADAAFAKLARDPWHADYGSTVRDAAAMVTVLGEVGLLGDRVQALVDRLPANAVAVRQTSTQEQAWLVLAAETLLSGGAPLKLTVTGTTPARGDPTFLAPTAAELAAGIRVANAGSAGVWQALTVSGVPVQPPPAQREGLKIKRNFFTRDGAPINLDMVRQNDVFVVVLEGEANTRLFHQVVVTHGLPAGWEIENPALGGEDTDGLDWLGEPTEAKAVAARDDRYVAAFDLAEDNPTFRLAFLVRAITPGSYELPGATVEDMYKPRFFARQATGRITVLPAP